jgi:hypothetical protein
MAGQLKAQTFFHNPRRIKMAEKRQSLKSVDGAQMGAGVYFAKFNDGTEFRADLRDLPIIDAEGKVVGKVGTSYDQYPPMVQRTLQYGIKQKLDDSMAGCETIEEAVEEVQSTWEAIVAGNWTIRVAGEGAEGGLFARAYAEGNGISLADAKAKIAALIEKNLAANQKLVEGKKDAKGNPIEITERMVLNKIREAVLEKNAKVKQAYDTLKEKRAAKVKKSAVQSVDLSDE